MFLFFCQLNINQLYLLFFCGAKLRKICEISDGFRQINAVEEVRYPFAGERKMMRGRRRTRWAKDKPNPAR